MSKPVREWIKLDGTWDLPFPSQPYREPDYDTIALTSCKQHLKRIKRPDGLTYGADLWALMRDKPSDMTVKQLWSHTEVQRMALEQTIKRTVREWPRCAHSDKALAVHWHGQYTKLAYWFCENCDSGGAPRMEETEWRKLTDYMGYTHITHGAKL